MVFWPADLVLGSDIEHMYANWCAHGVYQREYHDQVELGERVATALAEPPVSRLAR